MERMIALLRGINISGKNKIPMAALKEGFAALGFADIVTYLNSGNVIFSTDQQDTQVLAMDIQAMIQERFACSIPVLVIAQEALADALAHAPSWWGTDDPAIYDNLIFLMPPLSMEALYAALGPPKAEYEQAQPYQQVVFWSFRRKEYQKATWWRETARGAVKDQITIRTASTLRKVVQL